MRKTLAAILNSKKGLRPALLVAALLVTSVVPVLSITPTQTTLTIVNNSALEIRHLYLSPVDNDNWGPDQLNESVIAPGQSFTLSISSDQSQVKVIGEDQNGCFLSQTVASSGNPVWTINSDAVPNCGN
jgi:hypothetical protein